MSKGLKFAKDAAFLDFIAESNQMIRMWLWRSMVIDNLPPMLVLFLGIILILLLLFIGIV